MSLYEPVRQIYVPTLSNAYLSCNTDMLEDHTDFSFLSFFENEFKNSNFFFVSASQKKIHSFITILKLENLFTTMLKISINFGGRTKDGGSVDDDVGESVMLSSRRVRVGEKRDAVYAYGWSYDQTNMTRDRRIDPRGGREVRGRGERL